MTKIETIEKQLRTHEASLASLREALDEAADQENTEAIKDFQASVAATESLIASAERRLKAARAEMSEEARQALKVANENRAQVIADELGAAAGLGAKLDGAVSRLADVLKEITSHGDTARIAGAELVRQLPDKIVDQYRGLPLAAGFLDRSLGLYLSAALLQAGIFSKLAPNSDIHLERFDQASVAESLARHTGKLASAFGSLANQVNAAI